MRISDRRRVRRQYQPSQDPKNFTKFMRELRKQLNKAGGKDGKKYLLTAATSAAKDHIKHLELRKLKRYVDWFNVMTYDYHGSWDTVTNHLAPLYASPDDPAPWKEKRYMNINTSIKLYRYRGVPARKLVLGMPFYGKAWSGASPANNGLFQSAVYASTGTWEGGTYDFWDINTNILSIYPEQWDRYAKASWVYIPESGTMITYQSER